MLPQLPYNTHIKIIYINNLKIYTNYHVYSIPPNLHNKIKYIENILKNANKKFINISIFIDKYNNWTNELLNLIISNHFL